MSNAFPVLLDSTKNRQGPRVVSHVLWAEPPSLLEPSARLTVSSAGSCSEIETLQCNGATAGGLSLGTTETLGRRILPWGELFQVRQNVFFSSITGPDLLDASSNSPPSLLTSDNYTCLQTQPGASWMGDKIAQC